MQVDYTGVIQKVDYTGLIRGSYVVRHRVTGNFVPWNSGHATIREGGIL